MNTPNIGALAKLAPFLHCLEVGMHGEGTSVVRASDGRLVADDSTFSAGIAAALNEWAELRATVAELRRWRYEHDCRYTLGAVADLDLVHCPIDNPCVRCQRRLEWGAAQKENAELRAYRERTEAALQAWCFDARGCEIDDLKEAGLWRGPGQGATDGN